MLRRFALSLFFLGAFLGNPSVACGPSSDDPEWQYDEVDMEAAVVGTFTGTATVGGAAEQVTLTISRAPEPSEPTRSALRPACGSRAFFVRPAGACASMTTMDLTGELSSGTGAVAPVHFTGQFSASLILSGNLDLVGDDGSSLSATYQEGAFGGWSLRTGDGATLALDLVRQSR